jgi:hypothetical protein
MQIDLLTSRTAVDNRHEMRRWDYFLAPKGGSCPRRSRDKEQRSQKKKNGYESVSENYRTQLSWVPNSHCVIVARAASSNRSV